jgi:serine/threonine-protein kinase RsbT
MSDPRSGTISIATEGDLVSARRLVRRAAEALGFGLTDVTRIVTAASELAHNICCHAGSGNMRWLSLEEREVPGLELTFADKGPGIAKIDEAMRTGFSTRGRPGMGLPGAKLLVDELTIASEVGQGTTVIIRKWRRGPFLSPGTMGHD